MFRQLQHDVAVVTAGLEAGGIFVTEAAVIDQLKVRNKEYTRKPGVSALFGVSPVPRVMFANTCVS